MQGCEADVSSMVQLSHYCEIMMGRMNEKFRVYYQLQLEGYEQNVSSNANNNAPSSPTSSFTSLFSSHSTRRLKLAEESHYADFIVSWQVRYDKIKFIFIYYISILIDKRIVQAIVDSMYQLNKNLAEVGLSLHNLLAAETSQQSIEY